MASEWKKVQRSQVGNKARKTPAVHVDKKGTALVVVPDALIASQRVDIFSDGNGRLAYNFSNDGQFTVYSSGAYAKSKRVIIPNKFRRNWQPGTHESAVSVKDGVLIVDLSAIPTAASVSGASSDDFNLPV